MCEPEFRGRNSSTLVLPSAAVATGLCDIPDFVPRESSRGWMWCLIHLKQTQDCGAEGGIKLLNWGRSDSVLAFLPPLLFSWIYKSAGKFSAWDSLVAQTIKNLPAMQEIWVPFPGWEDPLEKEMATHSRILPWRIPWTEEPGGLQSMVLQRVRHDWVTNSFTFTFSEAAYWVSLFSPMNWFF